MVLMGQLISIQICIDHWFVKSRLLKQLPKNITEIEKHICFGGSSKWFQFFLEDPPNGFKSFGGPPNSSNYALEVYQLDQGPGFRSLT